MDIDCLFIWGLVCCEIHVCLVLEEGTLKKAPLLPHQLNIEHKGPDGVSSP